MWELWHRLPSKPVQYCPVGQIRFCCRETGRRKIGQWDRRVTTRQLINPPEFKLKKADLPESDVKATIYKIPVCCCCGGSDVTKLEESEQFEVEGSKGSRYVMRFHCNNSKCGFYWWLFKTYVLVIMAFVEKKAWKQKI